MKFSHYQKSIHGASYIHVSVLSDEGPTLEKLDYTIRIGSTPTFSYFDLYLYSAYAAHYVYFCIWYVIILYNVSVVTKYKEDHLFFIFVNLKDTAQTSMDDSAPVENPSSESFKCDLCQRSFNSESQMNAHLSGKAHQLLSQSKLESTSVVASPESASSSLAAADETPVIPGGMGATAPEENGPALSFGSNLTKVFHCAMCNITLNSQKQMEQHNKGLRHKIVIGKAKPPTVAGR